jgi:glycerate 2-kinase
MVDLRHLLLDLFTAGIDAVKPASLIHNCLALREDHLAVCGDKYILKPGQKIHVFGSGKASIGMAREVAEVLGDRLAGGVIVTNEKHQLPGFVVITGSHPVPDTRSVQAAEALQHGLAALGADDLYLFLLSGGSSALIEKPLPPLILADIQKITQLMLSSRVDISAINTVRKHLSGIKGGRLRHSTEASGAVLVLSDVVGDDLSVIGGAPLYADSSTFAEARSVLEHAAIWDKSPASVREVIAAGCAGKVSETPFSPSPACRHYLVGTNRTALKAAARRVEKEYAIPARIITSSLQGDARQAAHFIMSIAREIRLSANPFAAPVCLIFGGETTVQVTGQGKGGRNQELALSALAEVGDDPRIALLSCGTDGIDGNSHAAGAISDATAFVEARRLGLTVKDFQDNNNSTAFFEEVGSLVVTGPTGTNVMDVVFVVLL